MEKFWNMLHYFVYKFLAEFYLFISKIDPILNIAYRTEYAKKHFEKKGYDPKTVLLDTLNNSHYGVSTWFSYILLNLAFMPPGLFCIFLYERIFGVPNSPVPYIIALLSWAAIITVISYIYLMRKDKWIKYIRLYDRQSRTWKVKWGLISALVLVTPLVITIIGLKLL